MDTFNIDYNNYLIGNSIKASKTSSMDQFIKLTEATKKRWRSE